jgi:hypothetical protein
MVRMKMSSSCGLIRKAGQYATSRWITGRLVRGPLVKSDPLCELWVAMIQTPVIFPGACAWVIRLDVFAAADH